MKRMLVCLMAAGALFAAAAGRAAEKPAGEEPKKPAAEPPKAEQSVTEHSVEIGGKTVDYAATAGTLILRNDKDEPTAAVGYVAYTLRGAADPARRAVTFAYNGGPGSSSVWLHMGALGPRRI
ncbi:MAG: peptidase S10, partial [Acidobacteria bacterium]|nr:peptidase S10 [Acidobacteriota bacterium]